ncbi:MAG: AMP-binding protein [Rhodocyclaceae bacterium]|nr:AMP-binding protein [Rhodocyclaceae bacterium]
MSEQVEKDELGHWLNMLEGQGPWLKDAAPSPGKLARAWLRSEADVREIEKFSPDDLLPGATIYECVKAAAAVEPEKSAITQLLSADLAVPPRIIRYAELVALIERTANLFKALSGDERPAVALILPMLPEGLFAAWGAATAGIACPINPYLETRVVASIMNAAKATVLVTANAKYGPGVWDRLDEICRQVPTLRRVLVVDSDDPENDFQRQLAAQPAGRLTFIPESDPHGEAIYLPTGGTTAAPKLVRMTHRGLLLNAWLVGAFAGSARDGVVGHAMPNFHIGGLGVIALRTILFGQTLLTLTTDGFRNPQVIKNFWDIVRHYHMTCVLAVPTTAAAILAVPDTTAAGHTLRTFNCGASTVPVELMKGFHERFGIWLREIWGQSEIHGVVTANFSNGEEPRVGSVGQRLPFQPVKAIEVDAENNFVRECAPSERGVIAVCGPGVIGGYVDPQLDDEFFVKGMPDGKRWANTGDLGTVDSDGFVWLFGRAKDLIIRGGHNIDPKLIEEVLVGHPAVQMAAAIGRPDAAKGEMPIAYVVLNPGANADAAELLAYCRQHVQERAAAPVEIIVVPQLPMTAVGKISKPALRMDTMARLSIDLARDIVGEQGAVSVSVDDKGLRPRAVIDVTLTSGDRALVLERLQQCFRNYEFLSEVTVSGG